MAKNKILEGMDPFREEYTLAISSGVKKLDLSQLKFINDTISAMIKNKEKEQSEVNA